ncbi:hypothetical protein BGW36DRAFT_362961 [Talaromyces proteolyticus]|uniref:Uncharacterized protein n=1 Tax=Talaromyces proteolyticus TaxID=1131652 RepID=A0AAD4PWR9_9EURO|nr:uncharacterized protein BGW36DRAFT_362961 [Talaromyces proteolyticus]KAH8691934.1 hypothetical protein BGW36DRAFT_362961 [Talaromyces proteolyticus]
MIGMKNSVLKRMFMTDTKSNVQEEALKPEIEQVFNAFTDHGAVYYDPSLDNVICCVNEDSTNIKVMIVDIESVTFPDPIKPWESTINQGNANSLMGDLIDIRQQNCDHSHASSKMTEPGDDSTWKMAQSSIHTQLASQHSEASCHIMV